MKSSRGFHVVDYIVFAGTIIVSLAIGLYFAFTGGRHQTNKEYLTGGRQMMLFPVTVSLLVTFLSTIGLLGNPAEVYAHGAQYTLFVLAMMCGVTLGTFLFVPLYYPLNITSMFEYHKMRFGTRYVEIYMVLLSLVTLILVNGALLFSPCVAFEAVSRFPAWGSILICGVTSSIYTSLGGIKGVIWTDVFQAFVIFAGLVAIVAKGTYEVGSVKEVWRLNEEWGRLNFFDFRMDPTIRMTFWSVVFVDAVIWMCMMGSQQSVQRYNSLSSMKRATMSALLIIPGFILSSLLTCACGITAFAFYAKKGCDPLASGSIRSPNQILSYFVMDVLRVPCLPGLFIACIFSASLSSISSNLNAMAAITWENLLKQKFGHLSAKGQANITKVTAFSHGLLSMASAFLLMEMGGTLVRLTYSVIGALSGPLMGVTLLGGFFTWPGPRSALIASLLAVSLSVWISLGAQMSGAHSPPLAAPVDKCILTPVENSSVSSGSGMTLNISRSYPADIVGDGRSNSSFNNITADDHQSRSVLEWLYSVSYFYYPGLGILVVLVMGNLLSLIPGLDERKQIPKKLLFPCLRKHFGVKEDADTDDKQGPQEPMMTLPGQP